MFKLKLFFACLSPDPILPSHKSAVLTQAAPVPITSMQEGGLEKPAQVDAPPAEATLHQRNEDQLNARTQGLEKVLPGLNGLVESSVKPGNTLNLSSNSAFRRLPAGVDDVSGLSKSLDEVSIGGTRKRKQPDQQHPASLYPKAQAIPMELDGVTKTSGAAPPRKPIHEIR